MGNKQEKIPDKLKASAEEKDGAFENCNNKVNLNSHYLKFEAHETSRINCQSPFLQDTLDMGHGKRKSE